MRTDRLISILAADDTPTRPIAPRLLLQAGAGLLAAGVLALSFLGIRADLGAALADPVTLMKWLLPLAAGLPALRAALRLTRPQTGHGPAQIRLPLLVGGVALLWLVASGLSAATGTLWPQMRGGTATTCLTTVTLIGLVPLAVGLRVLRTGASPAPALSGAMLGLGSGGLAAAFYAMHCNQDSPLFFLTWYSLGILGLTVLGALAGSRLLRW